MALIALLVEGQTEKIFLEYFLPCIQSQDRLFVSNKLPVILENNIHVNKIWLKDCRGDGSIVSYIKKEIRAFTINNFDSIIIVRDYFPDNRPRTAVCKGDVWVLSSFLCKIFIGQFFKEWQILAHFSDRVRLPV